MNAKKKWTQKETDDLRMHYPDTPTAKLAKRYQCNTSAVYNKAYRLHLKKSNAYRVSQESGRLTNKSGHATRFAKGHQPHNKGKKGWLAGGNSAKTQFKKGNKSHTWLPIGSERTTKDGYLQRKVTDTGIKRRDWIGVHILLWKKHHGKIPKNHCIVFKNGNTKDISLSNLEVISRRELMARNTIHNLPKELVQVVQLKGALQRQINKRETHAK